MIDVQNGAGSPEIFICDEIGPDWLGMVSSNAVSEAIDLIGKVNEIVIRINSPGGDVFEGFAIYNALRRSKAKRITVEVDGLAASAASLVAMAGDSIRMAANSMMMIHCSWTIAMGNKADVAKMIEVLSRTDENLCRTYAARSGLTESRVAQMLEAETWMTAPEAVKLGFADLISQKPLAVAMATVPADRYRNVPRHIKQSRTPLLDAARRAAARRRASNNLYRR